MNKRNFTILILLAFCLPFYVVGQCNATPDATACYASSQTDVVILEMTNDQVTICSGSFEDSWDDLTVYSGAPGSGTGGTIVFGPADGDLSGTVLSTSAPGETLIFVSNSDGSVSCDSGAEDALEVYIAGCPTPPAPNLTPACGETVAYPACLDGYASGENVTITACPDPGGFVGISFTYVDVETSTSGDLCWDEITISTPSGGEGPLCGEPDGDGGVGTGLVPGDCFHSIAADECITVVFTSDGSVQETGFEFVVNCDVVSGADACAGAGTSAPLPVELVSFEGVAMERENKLMWKTASEENAEWHIIERSNNGQSNWTEIGRTAAAGTTVDVQQYELIDNMPIANAYYRIKSIDFDLRSEYSNIVNIKRANASGDINIYPNPVKDQLNVDFILDRSEEVSISLTDVTGKIVSFETFTAQRGENRHFVDFNNLQTGIYFISMTSSARNVTQRVVKN